MIHGYFVLTDNDYNREADPGISNLWGGGGGLGAQKMYGRDARVKPRLRALEAHFSLLWLSIHCFEEAHGGA